MIPDTSNIASFQNSDIELFFEQIQGVDTIDHKQD